MSLRCRSYCYALPSFSPFYTITIANSGWDLNFGLLSSICMDDTIVIYDELVHNSLLMGIRASKHQMAMKFRHNDVDALRLMLDACQGSTNKIIIVESIYSMDGGNAVAATVHRSIVIIITSSSMSP